MDDLITPAERLSPRRDKLADALRYLRTESRTGTASTGRSSACHRSSAR